MHDNRAQEKAYDDQAYPDEPHFWSEPARFAAAAMLHGCTAPPVSTARVLEIGCASGGNIIPMALRYPGGQFTGLDISSRQIAAAKSHAEEIGLSNMTFMHADICCIPEGIGSFDYIVAHGVYSWVPPDVRRELWQVCSRLLNGGGLLYMSYNTLPGWHFKRVIRDLLKFRLQGRPLDRENLSESVDFFIDIHANSTGLYKQLLDIEERFVDKNDLGYLRHEYLEEENHPFYVQDVIREARTFGFAYVCEADPASPNIDTISPRLRRQVAEDAGVVRERQEQYIDFSINRTFRRSVFAKTAGAKIAAGIAVDRLDSLYVVPVDAPALPRSLSDSPDFLAFPEDFFAEHPSAESAAGQARALEVLHLLQGRLPGAGAAFPVSEILYRSGESTDAEIDAARRAVLELLLRRSFIVSTEPLSWSYDIGKPRLQTQLRIDARHGRAASVNILHEKIRFTSDRSRAIMMLMDGTRSVAEIQAAVGSALADAETVQNVVAKIADLKLLY